MHGLIFVTWEKYLSERVSGAALRKYKDALEGKIAPTLLASRVYDDDLLLVAVTTASRITAISPETLLHEYGRYFITNGLTRHLCAYILTQVHNARELLLSMHDAHEQMGRLPESLTPPLFQYRTQANKPNELTLIYDSPRKLCPVLMGAIEGAAERYGERVQIVEQMCMKRGDPVCRFELRFAASAAGPQETPEQREHHQTKQQFAQVILTLLPDEGGFTLAEVQKAVVLRGMKQEWARPALLLEALRHLHHAGLAATSANHTGDDFANRRYWRAPGAGRHASGPLRIEREEHVRK
ncbi:MAG: heme NO-binding domain-containing protein [Ktedonobacteraceae bacterium]